MLKQRVIINDPTEVFFGQEGMVVVVRQRTNQGDNFHRSNIECKVLIGNKISNWIPCEWLDVVKNNSYAVV